MCESFINKYLNNCQLGLGRLKIDLDLRFLLSRFECRSKDIFYVQGRYLSVPPFSAQFCRVPGQEHTYALACEDGDIILLNSSASGKEACLKRWLAHNNAVYDVCWLSKSSHLISVAGDKTAILWDTLTHEPVATFKGHSSSVKSISLRPTNECVFATGGRDGNILLWDSRVTAKPHHMPVARLLGVHDRSVPFKVKKRLRKGAPPPLTHPLNNVSCVLFHDDTTLLSGGASDWSIKGWDIRWMTSNVPVPIFNINHGQENVKMHGYTSFVLNPNKKSFFASCTDGTISQYEIYRNDPKLVAQYHGHRVNTFYIKLDLSFDSQFLLSGSSDSKAYIWKVSKPGVPVASLSGHDAEVTAVAWHPKDNTKLITCGDDEQVFHWSINTRQPSDEDRCGENPIVGHYSAILSEELHRPFTVETPRLHTTPSLQPSSCPMTPASKQSCTISPLTQWFTPTSKPESTSNEVTPKTTSSNVLQAFTPVKSQRLVLGELNDGSSSEQRKLNAAVTSIRRTINFGMSAEMKSPNARLKKKAKLQHSNYTIKNFFQVTPRGQS